MKKIIAIEITGIDNITFPEPISFTGNEENILLAVNKFCREIELENDKAVIRFTAFYENNTVYAGAVVITSEFQNIHPRIFQWSVMRDIFSQVGIIGEKINPDIKRFIQDHSFGYEKQHFGFLLADMRRLNFIEVK
jgi:hypothetical protein